MGFLMEMGASSPRVRGSRNTNPMSRSGSRNTSPSRPKVVKIKPLRGSRQTGLC
ncbi:hypothetical protein TanjilG_08386 [Lupinus angustifolius]|uniref:Uncharacterized protein n=1 Tax=Lupinus angustifolius TaxID=3871 RepID=A0A1J7H342_LUPAN|nr:hypothetical protein TanjilG_08386 [Lupinus angustifolius]